MMNNGKAPANRTGGEDRILRAVLVGMLRQGIR